MKSENIVQAIGHIDEDLILHAENRSIKSTVESLKPYKQKTIRLAFAACLVIILSIGATIAFATGFFDSLKAYFGGNAELYMDEILSAVASVSNEEVQLRIEGAVADERSCHIIVSIIGLTQESRRKITKEGLKAWEIFDTYAILKNGERYDNFAKETGTYTDGSIFGRKGKTMYQDADQTYMYTYNFNNEGSKCDGININDVNVLCFSYEGLTLELDVGQYISEGRMLHSENPDDAGGISDFYASRIGLYYTVAIDENYNDGSFSLKLISADGTALGFDDLDIGYHLSSEDTGSDKLYVSGFWTGGSPVSVGIIDLDEYRGIQVNGINYYFVDELN